MCQCGVSVTAFVWSRACPIPHPSERVSKTLLRAYARAGTITHSSQTPPYPPHTRTHAGYNAQNQWFQAECGASNTWKNVPVCVPNCGKPQGPYSYDNNTCNWNSVPVGGSCSVKVRLSASVVGVHLGTCGIFILPFRFWFSLASFPRGRKLQREGVPVCLRGRAVRACGISFLPFCLWLFLLINFSHFPLPTRP